MIRNASPFSGGPREEALQLAFCSTHTVLRVQDGAFVSLADPPPELRAAAAVCENVGTWPVPVGELPDSSTMLSSPIILEDYPRVAPESPGDLFDGGEIDQLLILNILAMTDEEKAEMRASDPRAKEIIDRTEALTEEELMRLHGTIREFGLAR
jgi:hydrogenase maturation protease